jgi:hypothetical protein
MNRSALVAVVCALIGCRAASPCDGMPSLCVVVEASGPFHDLDALDGVITPSHQAAFKGQVRRSTPGAIRLPAEFAALLPSEVAGALTVEVIGMRAGSPVSYGQTTLMVPPTGQIAHVELSAAGAGADLSGSLDADEAVVGDLAAASTKMDLASPGTLRDLAAGSSADLAPVSCEPVTQSPCGASEKCAFVNDQYQCVPAGSLAPLAVCHDNDDQCGRGYTCVETTTEGMCSSFCSDSSSCPKGALAIGSTLEPKNVSQCVPSTIGSNYCSIPCNPVSAAGPAGCPTGFGCMYDLAPGNVEYTVCVWRGASVTTCMNINDCAQGYSCLDNKCLQLCRGGVDVDCDSPSFQCVSLASILNIPQPMFGVCCASSGC